MLRAEIFQLQLPLVGYASSDATLSNKDLYKYFLRTIPSDNLQAYAMADLISYFGWNYVNMIINDDVYGDSGYDAFVNGATERGICIENKIEIPGSGVGVDRTLRIKEAVETLHNSKASVVIVFTNEDTVMELFKELNKTDGASTFLWIASDKWASAASVYETFPEIAKGMFGFQLHAKPITDFNSYFSQLTPTTNKRNPYFQDYYNSFCYSNASGDDCLNGLTENSNYSQETIVPLVIDAVYAFANAIQNFLDNNCDSPIKWNRTTQQCDGMKYALTGETLLGYLFNVTFTSMQNRNVSFDDNGDPSGVYKICNLQRNERGHYEFATVGFWNSSHKENPLTLNINRTEDQVSSCSKPCGKGMIQSINNLNCSSCFECIPCIGPTYSANSSADNCSLCSDNHWGNNPLLGSTHCVPIEVRYLDFSSGWSIVSMCMASITLVILAAITVIMALNWNTPVVKSSGREQMVMLLIGVGVFCVLTYVVVSPPSIPVCVSQRIGVWLCSSLAFGALLVKIVRVARIFYSMKSSVKKLRFTDPKYQVMFTMAIVAGQLIPAVIGLGIYPPVVQRDPDVVRTDSVRQTGDAPEIIETCQQPHIALQIMLLAYSIIIVFACTILGWKTRKFPENFNEARHVMFTSFTLMAIWVLFTPLYFSTEDELQIGVSALGSVLSAIALMTGVFFPRVFIIIFKKHKNTKEYVTQQRHTIDTIETTHDNLSRAFQQSKSPLHKFM